MSFLATQWASKQSTDRPADKLVLWAMSDAARAERLAFLAVASVIEFTGLDRKTVLAAQARLKERGLIVDTGERCGATKQVIVWLIPHPEAEETDAVATVPKTEQSRKRNSPVSPGEQSQKGDTEPVSEPNPPDANASEGKARTRIPAFAQPYVEIWNTMAGRTGLAPVLAFDKKRLAALKTRLRDHGDDSFAKAVAAAERSKFCKGENGRGWRIDIGSLLRPGNYLKLLEGGFDAPGEGPTEGKSPVSPETLVQHYESTAGLYDRMGRSEEAVAMRASAAKLRHSMQPQCEGAR